MKDRTTAMTIRASFNNIRKTVGDMQDSVIKIIGKAADAEKDAAAKYNADFYKKAYREITVSYSAKIFREKEKARERVAIEFTTIRNALLDWMQTPPSNESMILIKNYFDFGIVPTKLEISLLQDLSRANYMSLRLVDALSQRSGMHDEDFSLIENHLRLLSEAEREAEAAIDNFCGILDDSCKYAADLAGLEISVDHRLSPIAERFLEDEGNAFATIEADLSQLTDSKLALTTQKRLELDKLFSSCRSDGERIDIAIEAIKSENTTLCEALELYDKDLYQQALDANAASATANAVELAKRSIDAAKADATATKSAFEAIRRADSFRSGSATT